MVHLAKQTKVRRTMTNKKKKSFNRRRTLETYKASRPDKDFSLEPSGCNVSEVTNVLRSPCLNRYSPFLVPVNRVGRYFCTTVGNYTHKCHLTGKPEIRERHRRLTSYRTRRDCYEANGKRRNEIKPKVRKHHALRYEVSFPSKKRKLLSAYTL